MKKVLLGIMLSLILYAAHAGADSYRSATGYLHAILDELRLIRELLQK